MQVVKTPEELQALCLAWKREGRRVGLVPTMGYLHEGHMALMDRARSLCDKLVVSVFVNPTQFGPDEDLDKYPHDFEGDRATAEAHGADVMFAPEPGAMYGPGHATWVVSPELERNLCGASRPVHFRGVCTVVTKLFMLAQPDVAVFGEKDWQQLAIIRRMVRDLNIPVEIVGQPIVREADGLAKSSRNAYLTADERALAPNLRKGLLKAAGRIEAGERDVEAVKAFVREEYARTIPMGEIDYVDLVDPETIAFVDRIDGPVLAAVAVRIGKARLLDNIFIKV
ncbi:pantoate--beta-alanine ligase [Pseudodesulfovibrio tunisiensis]|uniref:pantoate--beta-alanine ligase n=1 Tax=Pseudodesulfovibrio tunisiensis TaxID=463192 RepID=UPI001FB2F158|nr:pantoate--beta-alanine ligase [Pseudodesulfovibrio tunisiensis]